MCKVSHKEDELIEEATAEIFSVVQKEGTRDVKRNAKCYNLDAIIAVGYRGAFFIHQDIFSNY